MSYSTEVLTDAPLGYWRLGEASGTTMVDASGNGRDGTYTAGVTLAQVGLLPGDPDTAALFNGSAHGYVPFAGWESAPTQMTHEVWFTPSSVSGTQTIFCRHGGGGSAWILRLEGSNLVAYLNAAGWRTITMGGIAAGATYHVAQTFDGSTQSLYVNGTLIGTNGGLSYGATWTTDPIGIGGSGVAGSPGECLTGVIDEAAFYDHPLSGARIAAHYAAIPDVPLGAYETEVLADAPLVFWKLNDTYSSGSANALDYSGNGRTATIFATAGGPTLDGTSMRTTANTGQAMSMANAGWMDTPQFSAEIEVTLHSAVDSSSGDAVFGRFWGGLDWLIWRSTTNLIGFIPQGWTRLTGPTWVVDQTYLITVTADSTTACLYVDGVLVDSAAVGDLNMNPSPIDVGRYSGADVTVPDGTFRNASLYDHALSAARVADRYAAYSGTPDPDPGAPLTLTSETDVALPLVVPAPPVVSLGLATEVDVTPALIAPPIALGRATETDRTRRLVDPSQSVRSMGTAQLLLSGCQGGYFDLPPIMILTLLDKTLEQAPTSLVATLSMALPGAVTFDIDGIEIWNDTVPFSGNLGPMSLPVPEGLMAGTHVLTVTQDGRTVSVSFALAHNPDALPETVAPDTAPVLIPGSTGRWVFQDLMPGGLGSWVMPFNPVSAQPIPRTRNLQATASTRGRFHVTEGTNIAQDWSFAGYCPDQDFYNQLVAYATLKRRLYLIDHRGRAWRIAFLGVELVPRKRQVGVTGVLTDWGHDYTMRCVIYDQDPVEF